MDSRVHADSLGVNVCIMFVILGKPFTECRNRQRTDITPYNEQSCVMFLSGLRIWSLKSLKQISFQIGQEITFLSQAYQSFLSNFVKNVAATYPTYQKWTNINSWIIIRPVGNTWPHFLNQLIKLYEFNLYQNKTIFWGRFFGKLSFYKFFLYVGAFMRACTFTEHSLCAVPTLEEFEWSDRTKCPE